jgi:hypothetical protein
VDCQEKFYARSLVMMCEPYRYPASKSATHHALRSFCDLLSAARMGEGDDDAHPLLCQLDADGRPILRHLYAVLKTFHHCKCADKRDIVIGLLGYVRIKQRIEIDYSKSVEKVDAFVMMLDHAFGLPDLIWYSFDKLDETYYVLYNIGKT